MKTALALIIFGTALMAVAAYDTNVEAGATKELDNTCVNLTKAVRYIEKGYDANFVSWRKRNFREAIEIIQKVINENCRWQK